MESEMEVQIFFYEVHDKQQDKWHPWHTPATRQYIDLANERRLLEGTERLVDEHLIDGEGCALFGPYSQEAKLLVEFDKIGGTTAEDPNININQHKLAPLLTLRLIRTELKDGRLEFRLSPLGHLALKQLL